MPLQAIESLLASGQGGVFFLPAATEVKGLAALARRQGFAYFHIDGKNITRKEQLLNHAATAFRFPNHFGHNWDALEECLTDLEWVDGEGYVILYEHIDGFLEAHPDQFETLVEILRDAVASWKEDGESMVVLLTGAKAPKGVERLKKAAD